MQEPARIAWRLRVSGYVQGVGYRDWTRREALARGLSGWVRNRADGTVEAVIAGDPAALAQMRDAMRRGPSRARVAAIEQTDAAPDEAPPGFEIRPTV